MNFGQAIELLKQGGRITRPGWNGKGMYLWLERWEAFRDHRPNFAPCIIMQTAQGARQPGWLASQADMLAEDWMEAELVPRAIGA